MMIKRVLVKRVIMSKVMALVACFLLVVGCSDQKINKESGANEAPKGEPVEISYIQMINDQSGWSHYNNMLLRTDEGGTTWVKASPELETLQAGEYFFLNEDVAWIYQVEGEELVVYHTEDGGESWETYNTIIQGSEPTLFFLNETKGWMMTRGRGSNYGQEIFIYSTTDGGSSWTHVDSNIREFTSGFKNSIFFINQERGWINPYITTKELPWILSTETSGQTWEQQEIPYSESLPHDFFQIDIPQFVNDRKGILSIQTLCGEKNCAYFYETSDGGDTWVPKSEIQHNNIEELLLIDVVDNQTIWATDQTHNFYLSEDFGEEWEPISLAGKEITGEVIQLNFVSKEWGWILVKQNNKNLVFKTDDQGKSWEQLNPVLKD